MIDCVMAKGTNLKKNYLGEIINHNDIITTSLEIFFTNPLNNSQITTWLTKVNNNSQNIGEWQAAITIYNITFTNCRITSSKIATSPDPNENAIGRGKINLTIEEKVSGSYCAAQSHAANNFAAAEYGDVETQITSIAPYLDNIQENFSFKAEVAGQWSYNHTVSLKLQETLTNNITAARTVCARILDGTGPVGSPGIDSWISSGKYATHSGTLAGEYISAYYSEDFDLETGDYSLSKNYNLYEDAAGSHPLYTYNLTHSVKRDATGVMTVTEKGKVKARSNVNTDRNNEVSAGLNTILLGAYARCNAIYLEYQEANSVAGLIGIHLTLNKNIDLISKEHSYDITFSNDAAMTSTFFSSGLGNYRRESTITASQDSSHNMVMSENVKFVIQEQKGFPRVGIPNKDSVPLLNTLYNFDKTNSLARINQFYTEIKTNHDFGNQNIGVTESFKLVKRNLNYPTLGKQFSYSLEYTSDKTLVELGTDMYAAGIRKWSMSTEDEKANKMVSEYMVPGWKFLVHDAGQTSLGKRTVSASFSTARTITSSTVVTNHGNLILGANRLITPEIPIVAIKYAAWEVRKELLRWATDVNTNILFCPRTGQPLHFLSGVSYDFDSEGGVNISASLEYVQALAGGIRSKLWQ